jgi:hypothetical protein
MQELPDSSRVIYVQLKDWFPTSDTAYLMHVSQVLWETVYEPVERCLLDAHRLLDQYEIERGPGGHPYHVTERIVRLARCAPRPPVVAATQPMAAVGTPRVGAMAGPALAAPVGSVRAADPFTTAPWVPPDATPIARPAVGSAVVTPASVPEAEKRRPRRWRRRTLVGVLLTGILLATLAVLTVRQSSGYPNGPIASTAWQLAAKLPPVQSWLGDQFTGLGWRPDPSDPTVAERVRWVTHGQRWTRTIERVTIGSPAFCATFPADVGRCRVGQTALGPRRPS